MQKNTAYLVSFTDATSLQKLIHTVIRSGTSVASSTDATSLQELLQPVIRSGTSMVNATVTMTSQR
jgi:hypothetical protein